MVDDSIVWQIALSPEDPRVQVYILADRVEKLTKEKEVLEKQYAEVNARLSRLETAYDKGSGILLMLPVIGAVMAFLMAYWEKITKPWTSQ